MSERKRKNGKNLERRRVKNELLDAQARFALQDKELVCVMDIGSRNERISALRKRHFRLINRGLQRHAVRVGQGMRRAIDSTVIDP